MDIYDSLPTCFNEDVWDKLKNETRPIVVYGMGNGADKLVDRLMKYDIEISDYFASDGFVRGHSYRGKRVKSFSEIKEEYPEFVIVLSFASRIDEVINRFIELSGKYDFYIPDMPVANVDEYFDKEFYNSNYEKFAKVYELLEDEYSKKLFVSIIFYKITGSIDHLLAYTSTKDELYSLLPCANIRNAIDAGAYNGDTAKEMICYFPNLKNVKAIEPDKKNFAKLLRYSGAEDRILIDCYNAALWDKDSFVDFNQSGNRNSSVSSSTSYQFKEDTVSSLTLDSIIRDMVDYIKYDVEGAELEAILGSQNLIKKCNLH